MLWRVSRINRVILELPSGVVCLVGYCITVGESESEVAQSCRTLSDPMDYSLPGSSVHGIFQVRVLEWVAISSSSWDLPNPGVEPGCPAFQADALPFEPPGKPITVCRNI